MALRRAPAPALPREELVREVGERTRSARHGASVAAVEEALRDLLKDRGIRWRADRIRKTARYIADELVGLGPIGPLLRDPDVTEVMVNAPGRVFVERAGRIEAATVRYRSEDEVRHLIERVVSPLGLRVDASSPWVDARLPDGSRFHAVLPPIALGGPVVTIRRFSSNAWTLEDLVGLGMFDEPVAVRLAEAVRERRNVLVSGGGGSGKTTLLGVLARMIPVSERIITIEDAAELQLPDQHAVSLETRPPNVEGRGEVTLRDLVRCAMRMRPDRLIVGEVRGPEALDMLQALTSGHAGSMATVHADAPREALMRLELMTLLAAPGLSIQAARHQVAAAIDLVVHLERDAEGRRRVAEVVDIQVGPDGPELLREAG